MRKYTSSQAQVDNLHTIPVPVVLGLNTIARCLKMYGFGVINNTR